MIKVKNQFVQVVDSGTMTTGDGVRLNDKYVVKYRMEKLGETFGKPVIFMRSGKQLCSGISQSLDFNRFWNGKKDLSDIEKEFYWTRHLCKEVFVSVCTFKVKGTSIKVENGLKEMFHPEVVSQCKKFVKGKREKIPGLIQSLLDGYMWGKIPKEQGLNTVEIIDSMSKTDEEIEAYIGEIDFSDPINRTTLERLYDGDLEQYKDSLKYGTLRIGDPTFTPIESSLNP